MFGSTEMVIIAVIIFVLFGATAIPKFAKSLGQAKKEFKEATDDDNLKVEATSAEETRTKEEVSTSNTPAS